MRRNSSFFWASDALRNLETDDDDDDDSVLNDELEPVFSQNTSDSTTQVGFFLEAQHAAAATMETALSADEESQPLILSSAKTTGGYGSNGPQQSFEAISEGQQPQHHRFVFTHQEFGQGIRSPAQSSSKTRQSINRRKSTTQPCVPVLRFQVV
jgi:hypothetical protein